MVFVFLHACVHACGCVCAGGHGVVSIQACLPWSQRMFAEVSQNGWDSELLSSLPMIHGHSGEVYEARKLW